LHSLQHVTEVYRNSQHNKNLVESETGWCVVEASCADVREGGRIAAVGVGSVIDQA
jgi:hypothetical protein